MPGCPDAKVECIFQATSTVRRDPVPGSINGALCAVIRTGRRHHTVPPPHLADPGRTLPAAPRHRQQRRQALESRLPPTATVSPQASLSVTSLQRQAPDFSVIPHAAFRPPSVHLRAGATTARLNRRSGGVRQSFHIWSQTPQALLGGTGAAGGVSASRLQALAKWAHRHLVRN